MTIRIKRKEVTISILERGQATSYSLFGRERKSRKRLREL